jgi:hypothetical protein
MRRSLLASVVLLAFLVVGLPFGFAEPRDGWNLAARLPASTIAFVSAEQLDQLQARLKATAVGRMFDDPAMAEFMAPLKKASEQVIGQDIIPPPVMDALKQLEHLRGQLAVGFVGMNQANGEPQIVASLDFGTHVKDFAAFLEKLLAEVGGSSVRVETGTQDGRPMWTIHVQEGPTIAATIFDTVFVASTDAALLGTLAAPAATGSLAASADFQAVAARYGEGLALQVYGNVPAGLATFAGGWEGKSRAMADAMGLDTVKAVGYGMAISGDGFRDALVVHAPGSDHGLLTMFETSPLERPRLLDLVPGNAFLFAEANVNLGTYLTGVRKMFATLDPDMGAQMDEGIAEVNKALGVDLEKDVLGGLGSTLGYYAGLSSGGGLYPELALITTVKDPASFEATLVRLMDGIAGAVNEEGRVIARPREVVYEGQKLRMMELQKARGDDVVPFTPSWTLLGDRLVVTLVPYTLKDIVYRLKHPEQAGPALKDQEDFQSLWKAKPAQACSMGYLDLQAVLALLYDTGVPLLQTAVKPNMLGEAGMHVPLDWAALPPVRHVRQYFRSVGMYQVYGRDGMELHIAAPIPLMPILIAAVGAAAAFGVRSATQGSFTPPMVVEPIPDEGPLGASRETQARAQLEELVRYVQLYVVERNKLPGSFQDLVDAGFLEETPQDPWGRPVGLLVLDAAKRDFRVHSAGPDGEEKSADDLVVGPR